MQCPSVVLRGSLTWTILGVPQPLAHAEYYYYNYATSHREREREREREIVGWLAA